MSAHVLTWFRDTVNTHGTKILMDNSILSNSSTTKNKFYLTWSKWTLEMQLSVSIFPAIPQTATGQNGNKADHCHHTFKCCNLRNIDKTGSGFTLWKPRWHYLWCQTLLEHSTCSLHGCQCNRYFLKQFIFFFPIMIPQNMLSKWW